MSFFRRAWHAGADAYGQARAEQYGRRAKAAAVLGIVAILMLVAACWYVAQGPWG